MNAKNRPRQGRYSIKLQQIRRGNPDNVLREVSLISTQPWDASEGSANVALGLLMQILGEDLAALQRHTGGKTMSPMAIEILQKDHEAAPREWKHVDGIE